MFPRRSHRLRGAAALAAAAVLAAAGCTTAFKPRAPAPAAPDTPYQSGARAASLEVPPDLSRGGVQDAYPVPGARPRNTVLPTVEGMRIERDGHLRWLVVEADATDLWPAIRDFWRGQGFVLDIEDPNVGVMETGWAEERAQLPVGGIRRLFERFKRYAYSYAVRDRFRTRVERAEEPGVTEIHVTHTGAEEQVRGDAYAWAPRPSDPALEAEMLGRLMHYLAREEAPGADASVAAAGGAAPQPPARLVDDPRGGKHVRIDADFDRAWRLARRALDRAGFTVTDLDRSGGYFLVRYIDADAAAGKKRSWASRLAFWRDRSRENLPEDVDFRVVLERGDGPPTRVVVQDAEGARDTGESANRILAVLAENLG